MYTHHTLKIVSMPNDLRVSLDDFFREFFDTHTESKPTERTISDMKVELIALVEEMVNVHYKTTFDRAYKSKKPTKWTPENALRAARNHVREIVEAKLAKIMEDFYNSDEWK